MKPAVSKYLVTYLFVLVATGMFFYIRMWTIKVVKRGQKQNLIKTKIDVLLWFSLVFCLVRGEMMICLIIVAFPVLFYNAVIHLIM